MPKLTREDGTPKTPGMKYDEAIKTNNLDYRTWVYHPTEEAKIVSAFDAQQLMFDESSEWTMNPIEVSPDSIKENLDSQMIVGLTGRYANQLLMLNKVSDKEGLLNLQYDMFGVRSPSNIGIEKLKNKIRKLADEKGLAYDNDGGGNSEQSTSDTGG
ncbi:MAG: hypothetical protein GY799_16060 [Desulfobulbaceae bacterium]|nr:hypothetical protein [Desulfobulbaceae bacterium]